MPDTGQR